MGEALTNAELNDRKELESTYKSEIREVSNIVDFSEIFKRLSFDAKLDSALCLIKALEKAKHLNRKMENRLNQVYIDIKSIDELIKLLSSSKEISNGFSTMVNNLVKDKYILPAEIILLNQNISKLEEELLNLQEWMREKIEEIRAIRENMNMEIAHKENIIEIEQPNNLYTEYYDKAGIKPKK